MIVPSEFIFKANKYKETDENGNVLNEGSTEVVISVRKTRDNITVFKLGNINNIDVSTEFTFYSEPKCENGSITFIDLFSFPTNVCEISLNEGKITSIYFSSANAGINFSSSNKSIIFYGLVADDKISIKYVEDKTKIKDGRIYTGQALFDGISYIPNGIGIIYGDKCDVHGMYKDGFLDGLTYRDYHEYKMIGYSHFQKFEGWGIRLKNTNITFGIYEKDILRVNLTMLITEIWKEIVVLNHKNDYSIEVSESKIFVGFRDSHMRFFGFHFMKDGNVYFGISHDSQEDNVISGYYYKFDINSNIYLAEYEENGNEIEIVNEIDNEDFLTETNIYTAELNESFDIKRNYSIENFDIHKKLAYHIIEFGNLTSTKRIIIKAELLKIGNEGYSYSSNESTETRWFSFPSKFDLKLHEIMYRQEIWMPDLNDYSVDFMYIDNLGIPQKTIYKHLSFSTNDYNSDLDIYNKNSICIIGNPFAEDVTDKALALLNHLVPNWRGKMEGLKEQYYDNMFYSIEEYVDSLDSPDFFLWLFENEDYCNRYYEELPYQFQDAFNKFKLRLLNSL